MKIIICGAGGVGFSLAKYLSSEGLQVTVIDEDSDKLQKMTGTIDVRSIVGKTYNPSTLEDAGVFEADLLKSADQKPIDNEQYMLLEFTSSQVEKILEQLSRD